MSSKFFNNDSGNTLFDKLKGIACNMANFNRFLAVVGFFRSSGYFKLRKELNDVEEIKILVGINIDDIFRRHNKANFDESGKPRADKIESLLNDIDMGLFDSYLTWNYEAYVNVKEQIRMGQATTNVLSNMPIMVNTQINETKNK